MLAKDDIKQVSSLKAKSKSWQKKQQKFSFIDLFAGIGGFRIAAESLGGRCVFSSEWDKNSVQTYLANFNDFPEGDITKIDETKVPNHDILFAGFPCQSFSISGKKLGFNDTRGTLFFDIARIIRAKKPKMFLLENVKNFAKHDGGKTLEVILNTLKDLGYSVFYEVLNSSDYGLPQARERVYIVGFKKNLKNFDFPAKLPDFRSTVVRDILENSLVETKIIDKKIINSKQRSQASKRKPLRVGYFNKGGQGERVYSVDHVGITLSAYGGGLASKTGAYLINNIVRKLSPREAARMLGFPEDFEIPISTNLALKQFGDSISIPVVKKIIIKMLKNESTRTMKNNDHLVILGSETAKAGFKNELYAVNEFNNWQTSKLAKLWLEKMDYDLSSVDDVKAGKVTGSHKADIQVMIKLKNATAKLENIQVKLVSNPTGFNQIDKRQPAKYQELWDIPDDILQLLRYFTGELPPYKSSTRDKRRMFIDEFTPSEQVKIINFIKNNKDQIVSDILKGRGEFAGKWSGDH